MSTPLLGQSLFIEEAESTVVIQRDNLVRAKSEALKDAKAQVILQAVGRFLDFNSTISLKPLLQQHFLFHQNKIAQIHLHRWVVAIRSNREVGITTS